MFYVYEWYVVDTGEIIYVGKGTGKRYKVRKHNQFFNDMIKRNKCLSRIIREFEKEEDAFLYEYERINELRSIGQCVCNIYNGGYGGTIDWWTEERKKEYSVSNAMKSKEQRERMSKDNPMKNAEVAMKVGASKRIPIIINGIEYSSVKAACEATHKSAATINNWCIRGITPDGKECYYKDKKHEIAYTHINNGRGKELIYKGVVYKSTGELARQIGISQTTASRWCRQGRDSEGNPCRFTNGVEYSEFHIKQKSIPVVVNGVHYKSKEHAARELGVSTYKITRCLEGKSSDI